MNNEQITSHVKEAILEKLINKPAALEMSETFTTLGLDDLDKIEVIMKLEETFLIEISDDDADSLASLTDIVSFVENTL
ncbi:acyl carrier protein [bacterium]|jgi:acyl carrier protein|nr:acyl carrier protein [bacterium]MBT5015554.1 acyl carrier protein [bacterium]